MVSLSTTFWQGRRVLLTGHTGFKGSWLLLWLLELGAEVWGYALEPEPEPTLFRQLQPHLERRSFHHRIADLAEATTLREWVAECRPHVVLHLVAQPLVRRRYEDPLGTWATNVMGSLHLL
jgi:CDP-glucose 4,6-dehydratase